MRKAALAREPLAIPLREAKAPLVIAIDIGSSGLRSFLFDSRGRPAAALRAEIDPIATHARTGCTIHASYLPAKLRYLRAAAPEAFGRTARWLSLGEYLYFRLLGGTRAAHGMASATGLYDQRRCAWD